MIWKLRPYTDSDFALVVDSWLRCSRDHDLWFRRADIVRLLGTRRTDICCEEAVPDLIYGWVCHGPANGSEQLWFVYVKDLVRRAGIASWLIESTMPKSWQPAVDVEHIQKLGHFHKLCSKLKGQDGKESNAAKAG